MSEQGPKAGWYPDVKVAGGERFWDGEKWTDQRRDGQGRVPVQPTRVKVPKPARRSAGSNTYGLAGIFGYVMAGVLYANDEPELAGLAVAIALGCSLIAIIAVGVRLGHREYDEERQQ